MLRRRVPPLFRAGDLRCVVFLRATFFRVAFLRVAFLRPAFFRVAFLRPAFFRVAFLRPAFFRVAFFRTAFLRVAFLRPAFFRVAFFRVVRSATPPGTPVREIATRRPYDDPGVAEIWYRLQPIDQTIVHKTHIVYPFGASKRKRTREGRPTGKLSALVICIPGREITAELPSERKSAR